MGNFMLIFIIINYGVGNHQVYSD